MTNSYIHDVAHIQCSACASNTLPLVTGHVNSCTISTHLGTDRTQGGHTIETTLSQRSVGEKHRILVDNDKFTSEKTQDVESMLV